MKKITLLSAMLLSFMLIQAQPAHDFGQREKQIYSQKVAFITNALELTPEESAAFWPLYNEHNEKVKALSTSFRDYIKDLKVNFDAKTEQEAKEAVAFHQEHMQKITELNATYQNKYMTVISAKKVLLLLKAEKDFRRELLKKMGEKCRGGRQR